MSDERVWAHFDRPLWESLAITDEDPYGGIYETGRVFPRSTVLCLLCGVPVADRGLHFRFHVQIAALLSKIVGEREVLSTLTSEDEDEGRLMEHHDNGVITGTYVAQTFEIHDGLGNVLATFTEEDIHGAV